MDVSDVKVLFEKMYDEYCDSHREACALCGEDACDSCDMSHAVSEIYKALDVAGSMVRCAECKHWLHDYPMCTEFVGRCDLANYLIGKTGYCLYGEAK